MKKNDIKYIEKLAIIKDFSWTNCKSIIEFRFFIAKNDFNEDESTFELLLNYQTNNDFYKITLRFIHIESLKVSVDHKEIQLDILSVTDIRGEGWSRLNYWVKDLESENISFFCKNIEIISVEEQFKT